MNEEVYYKKYHTLSGFDLKITPLPPYYADVIDDLFPLKELPRREIELIAGDTVTEEYDQPEEKPSEDDPDFHLWLRTQEVKEYNTKLGVIRARIKRDMLFSICIDIEDGPSKPEDDLWHERLGAALAGKFKVPTDYQARRLLFIKYVILSHADDANNVLESAMFPEVSIQGISTALDNFQYNLGQATSITGDIWKQEELVES